MMFGRVLEFLIMVGTTERASRHPRQPLATRHVDGTITVHGILTEEGYTSVE